MLKEFTFGLLLSVVPVLGVRINIYEYYDCKFVMHKSYDALDNTFVQA